MKKRKTFTVSLNSSLDRAYTLGSLVFEDINRVTGWRMDPGGKGINVARMLRRLGGDPTAVTLLGGETGRVFEGLLQGERISYISVPVRGETRNIFNFLDRRTGRILRINEPGPRVSPSERKDLRAALLALPLVRGDIVAVSGSLPPGMPPTAYAQIVRMLRRKTPFVALDADGEAFARALAERPFLVKPNLWELERAAGRRIRSFAAAGRACRAMLDHGVATVILTHGERGAVLFSAETSVAAIPPRVAAESTVGCGDAFMAGFLHGLSRGMEAGESLRLAVACGAAKATLPGTLMPELPAVRRLLPKVSLIPPERFSLRT